MDNKPLTKHKIYLVRHGDVNVSSDICYGQLDCAVADSFDNDLLKLTYYVEANVMEKLKVNEKPLIISSPLTRCLALAEGLKLNLEFYPEKELKVSEYSQSAFTNPIELQINEAFQEINFGDWEGLTWQGLGQQAIQDWSDNLLDYTFKNGESARDFDRRVIQAWDELQTKLNGLNQVNSLDSLNNSDNLNSLNKLNDLNQANQEQQSKTIIIICHAGVIRSILSAFLHIPLQHSLSLKIDKMSVSCIELVPAQVELSRCVGINHLL
ncbi:histidine phosphatase family protein [Psychromonas sp. SP041]|uniref:histidine phosphatase family protein n=1 Tax=Psychromonas sp. SP041 TaxID=1365007 RepID=UPI0003FC0E64|nr:histidine phosphatase family protein [Psychromonas sp. SP041]